MYNVFIEECEQNTDICVVGRIMDDIEQAYHELEGKHGAHVETLNSEDEDDKVAIAAVCNDMDGMYRELCKVRVMYLQRKSVILS